jgi:hypothetical protein
MNHNKQHRHKPIDLKKVTDLFLTIEVKRLTKDLSDNDRVIKYLSGKKESGLLTNDERKALDTAIRRLKRLVKERAAVESEQGSRLYDRFLDEQIAEWNRLHPDDQIPTG